MVGVVGEVVGQGMGQTERPEGWPNKEGMDGRANGARKVDTRAKNLKKRHRQEM